MGVARDIALVFLSLQALIIVLVPLILISALAYGVYRLRLLIREYLRLAVSYVQKANDSVNRVAKSITDRFISIHTGAAKVTSMLNRLFLGGTREF
jgi:cell shape-determining protein MreC